MSYLPSQLPSMTAAQASPFGGINTQNIAKSVMDLKRQSIQNQYLPPELAAMVQQQQQKALQAKAITPYASQMAQGHALSSFPPQMMQFLSDPKNAVKNPALYRYYNGLMLQLIGRTNAPVGSDVTQPVNPLTVNATDPRTGATLPQAQQQSAADTAGSFFGNMGHGIEHLFGFGGNNQSAASSNPSGSSPMGRTGGMIQGPLQQSQQPISLPYGKTSGPPIQEYNSNDALQRKADVSLAIKNLSSNKGWNNLSVSQKHSKIREYLRGSGYE